MSIDRVRAALVGAVTNAKAEVRSVAVADEVASFAAERGCDVEHVVDATDTTGRGVGRDLRNGDGSADENKTEGLHGDGRGDGRMVVGRGVGRRCNKEVMLS